MDEEPLLGIHEIAALAGVTGELRRTGALVSRISRSRSLNCERARCSGGIKC